MPITVRLDELSKGPVRRTEPLQKSWCQERIGDHCRPADVPFEVELYVRAAATVVEADCRVQGALSLACSRCADPITVPFDVTFTHRFVPKGQLDTDGDYDDDLFAADPDVSEHDGGAIDLEPLCIEYALLELPFAPSCADRPQGPCPDWSDEPARFGDEFAEDEDESPWDALRKITVAPARNDDVDR